MLSYISKFLTGLNPPVFNYPMHETHLIETIFQYLDKEERLSSKKIRKISISLSEFGGISAEHFKEHFKRESTGGRWNALELEIKRIPYGPELEITKLDFE